MGAALVIGINRYGEDFRNLECCINDSNAIGDLLEFNPERANNLAVKRVNCDEGGVTTGHVRDHIRNHLEAPTDLIVIYFSGHGYVDERGDLGYLVTADGDRDRPGIEMPWLMGHVERRSRRERSTVIMLDCCHSGRLAGIAASTVTRGLSIIASCDEDQKSIESGEMGRFTALLADGLRGGAADLTGYVTPGSLYTHVDQSMGEVEQRPVFAANVSHSVVLRKCKPRIPPTLLRELPTLFEDPDVSVQLSPDMEPDRGADFDKIVPGDPEGRKLRNYPTNPKGVERLGKLQKLVKQGLVRPVDAEHMFFATIHSKSCELTELGQHYWQLAKKNKIRD